MTSTVKITIKELPTIMKLVKDIYIHVRLSPRDKWVYMKVGKEGIESLSTLPYDDEVYIYIGGDGDILYIG